MRSMRAVASPFRLFQPARSFPRRHLYVKFQMTPQPGETRNNWCRQAEEQIASEISRHRSHLVFMASETRVARPSETLKNAAKRHGVDIMMRVDLGFAESKMFTGHCALGWVNELGEIPPQYTFSLRPDIGQSPLYRAMPAPDPRLPAYLTEVPTTVWPAVHTTLRQEVAYWAKDAFYARYVHPERELYPLHCFFMPLGTLERLRYLKAVKAMKASCDRYSLLDHMHEQKIVAGENCTRVASLLEWMMPKSQRMKLSLGDNPTPQLVADRVAKRLINQEAVATESEDRLSRPFMRG